MTTYEIANVARSTYVTEIALIARALREDAKGAITHRESIDRARAILARKGGHAADCVVRAVRLAVGAETEAEASRLIESAIRFIGVACKAA